MTLVVAWVKNWFKSVTSPVQEVTVFFLMVEPDEWMAYVEEMPAINSSGSSAAQALGGLFRELRQYDSCSGTLTQVKYYKFLKTNLPF